MSAPLPPAHIDADLKELKGNAQGIEPAGPDAKRERLKKVAASISASSKSKPQRERSKDHEREKEKLYAGPAKAGPSARRFRAPHSVAVVR